MTLCPSREKLEKLANDQLPGVEQQMIETHIGGCTVCQHTIAALDQKFATQFWQPAPPEMAEPIKTQTLPEELRNQTRYRLLGVLGRGGMGTVYKAEHRLLERPVVLKVIRPDLIGNTSTVERFRREAKLAARLSHPNIVAVYEAEKL